MIRLVSTELLEGDFYTCANTKHKFSCRAARWIARGSLLLLLLLLLLVFLPQGGRGWQGRWLGVGWGRLGGRLWLQLPFSRTYFQSKN